MLRIFIFLLTMLFAVSATAAKPELLGYGVKSCSQYRSAYYGWKQGHEANIAQYQRFQDWLTGFLSGLSLAVGEDLLKGVEIESVMRRNNLYCEENTESDFFNATMKLLESLRKLP